ncbi:MAG: hypothetical protein GY729_04345 [Desulfobacteraceae bacterium]|nr:hypothetical protein [Desulfobacteraceae bacterium]
MKIHLRSSGTGKNFPEKCDTTFVASFQIVKRQFSRGFACNIPMSDKINHSFKEANVYTLSGEIL